MSVGAVLAAAGDEAICGADLALNNNDKNNNGCDPDGLFMVSHSWI